MLASIRTTSVLATAAVAVSLLFASTANADPAGIAAVDDGFTVATTDGCGAGHLGRATNTRPRSNCPRR